MKELLKNPDMLKGSVVKLEWKKDKGGKEGRELLQPREDSTDSVQLGLDSI